MKLVGISRLLGRSCPTLLELYCASCDHEEIKEDRLGFDWANRHREAVKGIAFMEAIVAPQGRDHWDKMGMRRALEALRSEAYLPAPPVSGLVPNISQRSVGRFLKGRRPPVRAVR
jgi:hypothetical protein